MTVIPVLPILAILYFTFGSTLEFSTYLGGPQYDGAFAITVDKTGNVYIGGGTTSTNTFPTENPLQLEYGGGFSDGIIACLNSGGNLLFSTYLGGSSYDYINAILLDLDGNMIVGGETRSTDLPTTDDAFQPNYGGGSAFGTGDGFIAKLTPDGSRILYCSYFGGNADETISGMALDAKGNLCLTGSTASRNFPLKKALQGAFAGGETDGFVAKFDSTLTNLIFSTYFGGSDREQDQKVAVDPEGFIYLCGDTLSTNFPVTAQAFQTNHWVVTNIGPNWDAVISKLAPDGSALIYSTYVGSAMGDAAYAIAADSDGSAYVTGSIAASWDAGTFPLGFEPDPAYGSSDAWVAKLKPDGSNFEWFSYLGGSGRDDGYGIALDGQRNVFVTGITDSRDFPIVDAAQARYGGGSQNGFVAKVSSDGQRLVYSTYLGGTGEDWCYAVAVDPIGNAVVAGQCASRDFPVLNAIQKTNASLPNISKPADACVVKLSPAIEPPALQIARSGSAVLISWPTNFSGFTLETLMPVPNSLIWTKAGAPPIVFGENYLAVQRAAASNQFFRLRR